MTITELREKRARLWNTMEGFLDTTEMIWVY